LTALSGEFTGGIKEPFIEQLPLFKEPAESVPETFSESRKTLF
jgi:hypothetical protein